MTTTLKRSGDIQVGSTLLSTLYSTHREAMAVIRAVSSNSYIVSDRDNGQQTTVTTAASAFTTAYTYLTSGRTWIEKIVCYGDFTITAAQTLPSYTELETFGRYLLPTSPASSLSIFNIAAATNVIVRGGTFTNTTYTNGESAGASGAVISIWNSSSLVTVTGLNINGYSGTAIRVSNSDQVLVTGCTVQNIALRGIHTLNSSHVTVSDNLIMNTGKGSTLGATQGDCVFIESTSSKIIVANNTIDTTSGIGRDGINIDLGSNDVIVNGNIVNSSGTTGSGIDLDCSSGASHTNNIIVMNNNILGWSVGITVQATSAGGGKLRYANVTDNQCFCPKGIFLGNNTEHVTIQNNVIAYPGTIGLEIANAANRINTNVINNISVGNSADFSVGSTTGTYLAGNIQTGTAGVSALREDLVIPSTTASTSSSTGALQVTGTGTIGGDVYVGGSCVCNGIQTNYAINQFWCLNADTPSTNGTVPSTLAASNWTLVSDNSIVNSSGATIMDTNGMLTIPIKGIYTIKLNARFSTLGYNTITIRPGATGQGHLGLDPTTRSMVAITYGNGTQLSVTYTALFQANDTVQPRFFTADSSRLMSTLGGTTMSLTLLQLVS